MPLPLFLVFESIIIYIIFVNIRRSSNGVIELISIVIPMCTAVMLVFTLNLDFSITAIIGNSAYIVIMTAVVILKTKNFYFSLIYAIFAVIIVLLSASLASALLTLVHYILPDFINLGWDGVMGSWVMSIIYLSTVFIIAYLISLKLGNSLQAQIKTFNDKMQKKLATSILLGAFITLGIFFITVFLRDILVEASLFTLVYALSLSIVFIYLVFSIFAFTESLRKDIELKHKNELLRNLDAYTKDVEAMATEMRKFRHDHMNLMLGFSEFRDNKDWDGFGKYYEKYMGEFSASAEIVEACKNKLGNIQTPELKSVLFAKSMQANTLNINTFIEVEKNIVISDGYNLLDTCRIAGILMDNAIEACKGVEGAIIQLMVTMTEDSVYLVFQNTCSTPPPMNRIAQKGFTTKEGARGIGLHSASQIVARNSNLTLKTSIKDSYFTQEFTIYES